MHQGNLSWQKASATIDSVFKPAVTSHKDKVSHARTKFVTLLAENNVPLSFADAFNKNVKDMFPDSEIAKDFKCGRTAATALLYDVGQNSRQKDVKNIKDNDYCYSLSIDGGSKYLSKLYPILIYSYNNDMEQIGWNLLDVHEIHECSTGKNVFELMKKSVETSDLKWDHMLSLSADNTNSMSGQHEGVYGHILRVNPNCHFSGCICHLLDLVAKKAHKKLACDIDELIISIYYYLENSDVRQLEYKMVQELNGENVAAAIKHVKTRWLSLRTVLPYYLSHWSSLKNHFRAERDKSIQDVKKLSDKLQKPKGNASADEIIELQWKEVKKSNKVKFICDSLNENSTRLAAEFLNFITEPMTKFNLIFQEYEPIIHRAQLCIESLIRELQNGFLKPSATKGQIPSTVKHTVRVNQKSDTEIMIGDGATNYLKNKKPSKATTSIFYNSVREYYIALLDYIKGPLMDKVGPELLKAASVADTARIQEAKFSSLTYFIEKYPSLSPKCQMQDLQREFNEYVSDEFPNLITKDTNFKKTGRTDNDTFIPKQKPVMERQDKRWAWISKLVDPATGSMKYQHLSRLMIEILCIPLSQASAKRQFSMLRKIIKGIGPIWACPHWMPSCLSRATRISCNAGE